MEDFDLKSYCEKFIQDESLGDLPFFKDQSITYSYRDLIQSVILKIDEFKKSDSIFSALKLESSYHLFVQLLAGSFVQKELLLLSHLEPPASVLAYQKNIPFTEVITDSDTLSGTQRNLPDFKIDYDKAAFYILSSGSSGPSKAIGLSLNNVYHSAISLINFFEMKKSDTTFLNLPHHHIGGLMILWRAFFSQGSVTKKESDDYQFISLVPLQLKRFLRIPEKIEKLKKCRGILIGGAPLTKELRADAETAGLIVYETYGMSETSSLVMLNGIPLEGQNVKLDNENHFLIKGPTLSPFVAVDVDGFFHTKDIGLLNPDNSFSFVHRSDILFKSAGELINPFTIEDKLKTLPWITNAVVVPVDHPEWTKGATLIYQVNDPTKSVSDIKEFLKKEVHPFHIPKFYYEAPKHLIADGMKPKRFEITLWAQEQFFKDQLHYLYIPNPKSKKLMVMFHGFMEDHTDMIPVMDNHADMAFLLIDAPGHGKSDIQKFKSREHFFTTLESIISFYKRHMEVIYFGYSMGGRIAIELASDFLKPDLLILESSHFGLNTEEEKEARLKSDLLLFKDKTDLKEFFTNWYKNPIFADFNKSPHYEAEVAKKLNHDSSQWQSSLEFFSPGASPHFSKDITHKLREQKIIAIAGSNDEKYKNHFLEMKKYLKNLIYFEIPNSGHNPHKTHLNELKTILRSLI